VTHTETTYDGPYISGRRRRRGRDVIWIENGTQTELEQFGAPRPIVSGRDHGDLALRRADLFDRAVESFRIEAFGLDTYDPLLDDLEESGPGKKPNDTPTPATENASSRPTTILRVQVLGPVEVSGWAAPPERGVITELACYLALHRDRGLSGDQLRAALWPDPASEPSAKTLRTYLSLLRKAAGPAALPGGARDGYRFGSAITTDWTDFCILSSSELVEEKLEALALVRGRPFEGVGPGTYAWVFSELWVSDMEIRIVGVALEVAALLETSGDAERALRAVRHALRAVPSDLTLWAHYLELASAQGQTTLQRARAEARAALGDDADQLH
jgi:hypothetical protein